MTVSIKEPLYLAEVHHLRQIEETWKILENLDGVSGDSFFKLLILNLGKIMDVRHAWITEFVVNPMCIKSLAFCSHGKLMPNFEYSFDEAFSEKFFELFHSNRNSRAEILTKIFSHHDVVDSIHGRNFLEIPLIDSSKNTLGYIGIICEKAPDLSIELVLKQFANRARMELERIRVDNALKEQKLRLAKIIDTTLDAVVTFDENYRILIFNASAESMFHSPDGYNIGHSFKRFLTAKFIEAIEKYKRELKEDTQKIYLGKEFYARRNDMEFPVESSLSHATVHGKTYFTLILKDLSEKSRMTAELRRLKNEKSYLQDEINSIYNFENTIGSSVVIRNVLRQVELVAKTDSTVLLNGETGTGKELIARTIHNLSSRNKNVMIKVNCAALPVTLIESELFGYEKGAFTGAAITKKGRFELAHNGTLFLDEIGELSMETQAKILRVLQEQEFERVGGTQTIKVNVRIIAATHQNLHKAVAEKRFREDLFYRLNVFPIQIPPLRHRTEDLPVLVNFFVNKFAFRMNKKIYSIDPDTMKLLSSYHWPGNIRELGNIIERAIILCDGDTLLPEHIGINSDPENSPMKTLEEIEKQHIINTLKLTGGVVAGPNGAAKRLGINRSTLLSRMRKLKIKASR